MNEFWGYHLILDCAKGDKNRTSCGLCIDKFTKELIPALGLKAYGEPTIAHFATHIPKAAGFSLVQLIETSAIMGHFSDLTGDFYLDVFSCKEFDVDIAQEIVEKYFQPDNIRVIFLTRQA